MNPATRSPSPVAWLTYLYLLLLLMLGGGGTPAPLSELACQIIAALTLVCWVGLGGPKTIAEQRKLAWVTGLIAVLPVAQLIPLPPAVWHALPGRELQAEALTLIGRDSAWQPLSIAPFRTLEALLSLLPPLVAMLLVGSLSTTERHGLLKVIAGFALVSLAIGAGQIASGGDGWLHFYGPAEPGVVFGFQANRNAQVDVLLIGSLAAMAAGHDQAKRSLAAAALVGAIALLLLLGAALTQSRTGIALVSVLLAWFTLLQPWRLAADSRVRKTPVILASGLVLAGLLAAVWQSRAFGRIMARFEFGGEYRPDIWRDTIFAIGQFWPLGSGIGTFTRAIGPAERLEAIGPTLLNRAHNDYLELLLEAGLPGALAGLAIGWLVLVAVRQSLRQNSPVPLAQAVFAGGTISLIALHSLVDYPLRSMALAGLAGLAAALILAPANSGIRST